MSIKPIQVADIATLSGDSKSVLRKHCAPVGEIDNYVRGVVQDLIDTLHSDTLSVGLSAPQVGYNIAVSVINLDKTNNKDDLVLINPIVISETGQWDIKYESCMSIPHKKGLVKCRKKVVVKYLSLDGIEKEIKATSFEARVLLHEIDHLNGVLFSDRMDGVDVLEDTEMFREHGIE